VKVVVKGQVQGLYSHAWDLWNARHHFETTSITSYNKSIAENNPDLIEVTTIMYRLFDRDRGHANHDGQELSSDDRKRATENAFQRWKADAYLLTVPYRLTDPGVYVALSGESKDEHCRDGCDIVAITFDPAVGKDKYWLHVNKQTGVPEMIEMELDGRTGRIAYQMTDWTEAGGLKFPTKLDNIGARNIGEEELWTFSNIRIGDPDDTLYIPRVH